MWNRYACKYIRTYRRIHTEHTFSSYAIVVTRSTISAFMILEGLVSIVGIYVCVHNMLSWVLQQINRPSSQPVSQPTIHSTVEWTVSERVLNRLNSKSEWVNRFILIYHDHIINMYTYYWNRVVPIFICMFEYLPSVWCNQWNRWYVIAEISLFSHANIHTNILTIVHNSMYTLNSHPPRFAVGNKWKSSSTHIHLVLQLISFLSNVLCILLQYDNLATTHPPSLPTRPI